MSSDIVPKREHGADKNSLIPMPNSGAIALRINSLQELISFGEVLGKSGYFQDARGGAQCVVKCLAGAELGFSAIASMTGIHIIEGKPSIGAHLMAAMIRRSDRYDYDIETMTSEVCELVFWERSLSKGGEERKGKAGWIRKKEPIRLTMKEAVERGMALGRDGKTLRTNWRTSPDDMLFARCISKGFRRYCADLTSGVTVYIEGELEPQEPQPSDEGAARTGAPLPETERPLAQQQPEPAAPSLPQRVSEEQANELSRLLNLPGAPAVADFLKRYAVKAVAFLPAEHYSDAVRWLSSETAKAQQPKEPKSDAPSKPAFITREQFDALFKHLERAPNFAKQLLETAGVERWGLLPQLLYPLVYGIAAQPDFDLARFQRQALGGRTILQLTDMERESVLRELAGVSAVGASHA